MHCYHIQPSAQIALPHAALLCFVFPLVLFYLSHRAFAFGGQFFPLWRDRRDRRALIFQSRILAASRPHKIFWLAFLAPWRPRHSPDDESKSYHYCSKLPFIYLLFSLYPLGAS